MAGRTNVAISPNTPPKTIVRFTGPPSDPADVPYPTITLPRMNGWITQRHVNGTFPVLAPNRSVNAVAFPAFAPSTPELSKSWVLVITPSPAGGPNLGSRSSSTCEAPPGQAVASVVAFGSTGWSGMVPVSPSGSHTGTKLLFEIR